MSGHLGITPAELVWTVTDGITDHGSGNSPGAAAASFREILFAAQERTAGRIAKLDAALERDLGRRPPLSPQ